MNKIKHLLWENAGAIFCYTVMILLFVLFVTAHQTGMITLKM